MSKAVTNKPLRPSTLGTARRQRGVVLLVVLVVLSLMFLAGLGVMRAADTSNVIAGNFSFQQAAVQASDRAIRDAMNTLAGVVAAGGGNNDVANRYFATQQTVLDAKGIPTAINWNNVSCSDPDGVAVANCALENGGYRVQYVIERLCSSNPTISTPPATSDLADIRAKCEYEPNLLATDAAYQAPTPPGGTAPAPTANSATSIALRYRVLIHVRGPRGTEGWFESVVSGPATS
ncbi:pilus assembly PilX family protein [Methylibium petroleiphilum]|uniref:pilus assembly PilX family protein n=1 Tax=Methylibium petroleiphilum TaxID=105560 RepID=UPI001AC24D04|nr:hypothetical protein [Methylibium petroleiphilum]MBN9206575.1 hypothetical protein [Methylibium petroleiphilum]